MTRVLIALLTVAAAAPLQARGSWLAEVAGDGASVQLEHQVRNHETMAAAVAALDPEHRPEVIAYLASGSHMAPLGLCDLLPADSTCTLLYTEIDPEVQTAIGDFLSRAANAALIRELATDDPVAPDGGRRTWSFQAAERRIVLELRVDPDATGLVDAALLTQADLVISHDWSGDPLGNLAVIAQFLDAARAVDSDRLPMLLIEDLEAHPYPVDLSLFSPVARAAGPYGHRTSDAGLGSHGAVELGPPLFAGAVLLDFGSFWWRRVDSGNLASVLDFTILHRFDDGRRNILEGGPQPIVAPRLLDWWTGFGTRLPSGADLNASPAPRVDAVRAAAALRRILPPDLTGQVERQLLAYRSLLEARAAGSKPDIPPPAGPDPTVLRADQFPTRRMSELHREALRHISRYREERARAAQLSAPALEELRTLDLTPPEECAVFDPDGADTAAAWSAHYECLIAGP